MFLIGGFVCSILYIYYNPLSFLEKWGRIQNFLNSKQLFIKEHEKHSVYEINHNGNLKFVLNENIPNIFSSVNLKINNHELDCTKHMNAFVYRNSQINTDDIIDFILYLNSMEIDEKTDIYWEIITNKAEFINGTKLVLNIDNNFNITTI